MGDSLGPLPSPAIGAAEPLAGEDHGCDTGLHAELRLHVGDVYARSLRADAEVGGDLPVRAALGELCEDFLLSDGQGTERCLKLARVRTTYRRCLLHPA